MNMYTGTMNSDKLSNLCKMYNFNQNVTVTFDEIEKRATGLTDAIYKRSQEIGGNRSYETIKKHCFSGVFLEYGITKIVDGELNGDTFDKSNRASYATDVYSGDGMRLEVKPHKEKWYSFNLEKINTMLDNCALNEIDFIVTASQYQKDEKSQIIVPKMVARADMFHNYITKSKYKNKYSNYYYNHITASAKADCVTFNM